MCIVSLTVVPLSTVKNVEPVKPLKKAGPWRIDGQGRQLDAVTNEIGGKHGIEERLENVQH